MVDHGDGKIPPTAHPYNASPFKIESKLQYCINCEYPLVSVLLIRHKNKPVPILEVDFYVLERSKQSLVVLTTLIAHKLTKCHT